MADVQERTGLGRPAVIAIGFAVVALLTSLVAVVVVARRGGGEAPVVAAPTSSIIERTVDASEITKLKRDVVERVTDDKGAVIGVTLKDESLRGVLGLQPGDVITVLGGRAIKREFDVYDAVLGMSTMDASIIYVDIVRDKHSIVVRWKIIGDLRSARRDPIRPAPPNPFLASPAPHDPLADTIRKIDNLHYEVPRSTIDRILTDPDTYARQARIVPSIHNGQPNGFKLYAIRPGSLWSAIGVGNGDTLQRINGRELSSPDKALEIYTKIKAADELRLDVMRRSGVEETIDITIK